MIRHTNSFFFFFFNDTATTEIYTLSLHDALPIYDRQISAPADRVRGRRSRACRRAQAESRRSEEHTSELQSQSNLVCRLLLEKKKKMLYSYIYYTHTISKAHTYKFTTNTWTTRLL